MRSSKWSFFVSIKVVQIQRSYFTERQVGRKAKNNERRNTSESNSFIKSE